MTWLHPAASPAHLYAEDVALRLERFLMKAGPTARCCEGLLPESSKGSSGICGHVVEAARALLFLCWDRRGGSGSLSSLLSV